MAFLAPSGSEWSDIGTGRKAFTTIWALLECLLSGVIYGWPSLIIILKEEGVFGDLCETEITQRRTTGHNYTRPRTFQNETKVWHADVYIHETGCPEQDERFSLVFMLCAITMTVGCAVFGHIQYMWGSRVTRLIDMALYMFGAVCMAFVNRDRSWLLFLAAPAIATAGPPILIVNIQVANLYTRGASMLVGLFTGTYDASAIVQLLIKFAYYRGISVRTSYLCITCLLSLMLAGTFFIFPKKYIPKSIEIEITLDNEKEKPNGQPRALEDQQPIVITEKPQIVYTQKGPSLTSCLKSRLYMFHVFWLSVLQLRFYFYIGSFNAFLEYTTQWDKLRVNHYTNMSLYIQMAGLAGAPLIGLLLDLQRHRHRRALTQHERLLKPTILPLLLTCFIATLLSGIILVPSMSILILLFIVFTLYRASLYGLVAAFIQMIFPSRYFGTLWGVTMVVGGLFSALQYPLVIWMDCPPIGPLKVNVFLLVLSLFAFAHPIYIWLSCRSSSKQITREHSEHTQTLVNT